MAKNTKRIVNVMSKGVSAGDAIGITRIQDLMRAKKKAERAKKERKVKDVYGEKHTAKETRGNSYLVGGGNTTFIHKSKASEVKEGGGRRDDYCRDDEGKFSSC